MRNIKSFKVFENNDEISKLNSILEEALSSVVDEHDPNISHFSDGDIHVIRLMFVGMNRSKFDLSISEVRDLVEDSTKFAEIYKMLSRSMMMIESSGYNCTLTNSNMSNVRESSPFYIDLRVSDYDTKIGVDWITLDDDNDMVRISKSKVLEYLKKNSMELNEIDTDKFNNIDIYFTGDTELYKEKIEREILNVGTDVFAILNIEFFHDRIRLVINDDYEIDITK